MGKMMFKLHTIHTNCFSKDNKLMCTFNFAPIILSQKMQKDFMDAKRCKIYTLFQFSFSPCATREQFYIETRVCVCVCVHWMGHACFCWSIIKYDKLKYKICN